MPFEAWHVAHLQLRPEQESIATDLTNDYAQALEQAGAAFTVWAGSTVIMCAGYIHFWPGRAQVWAMVSHNIPAYGGSVHRHVKQYIDAHPVARLECIIDPNFDVSVRWALRLGFAYESTMKRYGIRGQDMDMYVLEGRR